MPKVLLIALFLITALSTYASPPIDRFFVSMEPNTLSPFYLQLRYQKTGELYWQIPQKVNNSFFGEPGFAISKDQSTVAITVSDKTVALFSIDKKKQLQIIHFNKLKKVNRLSFSSDGSKLLAHYGTWAEIYDLAVNKSIFATADWSHHPAKLSPDGNTYVSYDNTKNFYRVHDVKLNKLKFSIESATEASAAIAPDNKKLLVAGHRHVSIFDIDTKRKVFYLEIDDKFSFQVHKAYFHSNSDHIVVRWRNAYKNIYYDELYHLTDALEGERVYTCINPHVYDDLGRNSRLILSSKSDVFVCLSTHNKANSGIFTYGEISGSAHYHSSFKDDFKFSSDGKLFASIANIVDREDGSYSLVTVQDLSRSGETVLARRVKAGNSIQFVDGDSKIAILEYGKFISTLELSADKQRQR